jgi:hypothetical protein
LILSVDKRFIFIHVPKAAGTSIHGALSLHDVFLPVRNGPAAQRAHLAEKAGLPRAAADLHVHSSARAFIAALGRETYDSYFSFSFVRNPWDVAVSWFHYRLINPQVAGHKEAVAAGTFDAYVKTCLRGPIVAQLVGVQHPFVLDGNGVLAVNFIGRFETLESDFAAVKARAGIATLELDHFNQSYHPAWPALYNRETFGIVAGLIKRDAELFGYSQDPAAYGIA